jgi:formylglycine-generating enzyme required for sulfatase activity
LADGLTMPNRRPLIFPPEFAAAWGDDRYGLWADLEVDGAKPDEPVVQRLRWIEPGRFRLGSPDDEPGRDRNEGPQCLVTLSQGLWLADTACTQSLWRAIMGDNPSHFRGDERPVEQVSWKDVQRFLERLNQSLPGSCTAVLPTEAEWEYACRAGTTTPFWHGESITPDLVNYDGSSRYLNSIQLLQPRIHRGETVAVKSLPPNGWGLYEMHGNVWEWCADFQSDYTAEAKRDPRGTADSPLRALRGGSWKVGAGGARSACRGGAHRGSDWSDSGFRFALRSIEPGPRSGGFAGGAGPGFGRGAPGRSRRRRDRPPRRRCGSGPG